MNENKCRTLRVTSNDLVEVVLEEHSERSRCGDLNTVKSVTLTYSQLVTLLNRGKSRQSSRKSKTPASKMSRQVALLVRAIDTGKWSTGADIDREEMVAQLIRLLSESKVDLVDLTDKAHESLLKLRLMRDCFADTYRYDEYVSLTNCILPE